MSLSQRIPKPLFVPIAGLLRWMRTIFAKSRAWEWNQTGVAVKVQSHQKPAKKKSIPIDGNVEIVGKRLSILSCCVTRKSWKYHNNLNRLLWKSEKVGCCCQQAILNFFFYITKILHEWSRYGHRPPHFSYAADFSIISFYNPFVLGKVFAEV